MLCLADAIHNFKWVKIIKIWQNGGQLFSNIALTFLKGGTWCTNKKWKPEYMRHRRLKGLIQLFALSLGACLRGLTYVLLKHEMVTDVT